VFDVTQPISLWVVFSTVGAIVALIALGIMWVNKKKIKENE
jgi:hypothetical protein